MSAAADSKVVTKSKPRVNQVTFLAGEVCLYSVVKRAAASLGWALIDESAPEKAKQNCHVVWVDRSFANDKLFLSLQPWQRINHFPGMTNICRKTRLAANLEVMRKEFPQEFCFFPQTFILPQQFASFKSSMFVSGQCKNPFIIKPDGAAQGKGIFLTKSLEDVQSAMINSACVAQEYIKNPLLIDGKKFDLRIYLLVMSCDPLRLYLFRDGLVRMCTEDYIRPNSANMSDRCMHLTNYAVNKHSDKYQREAGEEDQSGQGSKRSIRWLLSWLGEERGKDKADEMWSKIGDICVMTLLSIQPTLKREYASTWRQSVTTDDEPHSHCFEILGIDIMLDSTLRPHLIEVNHLPSWGTDSQLDDEIKSRVILQALQAINVKAGDRRKFTRAVKRQSRMRLGKQTPVSNGDVSDEDAGSPQGTADDEQDRVSETKSRPPPNLFDSNSTERKIQAIYAKHAPERLERLPALLERFRGYESWLLMKVQNKYEKDETSSDEDSSDESDTSDEPEQLYAQHLEYKEEERVLEGYDRIYPPKGHGRISPSRFKEMEEYIAEVDYQQQRRLLCPLQQIRSNGDSETDNVPDVQQQGWSRADGWIGGNIHIRKNSQHTKIIAPPTQKQIEFADRLSQGFSTSNIAISKTALQQRKSRILNHDLIYEEVNPLFHLTDRVSQAREMAKNARKRAEGKLNRRTNPGVAVRQQVLDLGLSNDCLRLRTDEKFYSKKSYQAR